MHEEDIKGAIASLLVFIGLALAIPVFWKALPQISCNIQIKVEITNQENYGIQERREKQ